MQIRTLLLIVLLVLTGCTTNSNLTETVKEDSPENYVLFTLNTQHFMDPDLSYQTLIHVLELHEKYEIPIDIFLNDPIVQAYQNNYPEVFKTLADSDFANVSYHFRPPFPYSSSYDFIDLENMDSKTMYDTIMKYETHALDWETGETTSNPGGYTYLSDLIGYNPTIVDMSASENVKPILAQVYKELGASFSITHSLGEIYLGAEKDGLYIRPETQEIKLFDEIGEDIGKIVSKAFETGDENKDHYVNIKMHDNNFITDQSAWTAIYTRQKPPYDLSRYDNIEILTEDEQNAVWETYEETLKYISENDYSPINASDLQSQLQHLK